MTELQRLTQAVVDAQRAIPQARLEHELALEKLITKESEHAIAVDRLVSFKKRQGLQ